ncbi:hypothetical protein ABIE26_000150 [Pedobacter africanus]|uniref:Uncharacterized protein n=1 Tax=Pedobacter africanus TaxID=151894 RepID=A0ACC6KW17_9SPHI|nr:right-handed parallel beta-helix repeat-containing protein [Pedobacter africanus]MDR6783362.1 hypothetical protein [Pedobacter africanus]
MKSLSTLIKLVVCSSFCLIITGNTSYGQTLVTYPEPVASFEKKSDLYLVSVTSGSETKDSYVYVSRAGTGAPLWEWQGMEGRTFHFTTFSFSGTATVTVTKLGSTATSATLRPDRVGLGTVSTTSVSGGKQVTFTLSQSRKISVEFDDDAGLQHTLMIFADPLEAAADIPDSTAANVYKVSTVDTLIVPAGKTIVYFAPGLYNIHYWRVPATVSQVYISGGAYVRGYIGANRTTTTLSLKINGRGIISNDVWGFHYPKVTPPYDPVSTDWYKSIVISGGKKHTVEGITLVDGTSFNVVLSCDSSLAKNLKIHGFRYNNDGITLAGSDATVTDCFVRVGDDGILTNGSKNFKIDKCVFWHLRGGSIIQLGWRPHNISGTNVIENCDVIHAEWILPQTQNSGFINYMGNVSGASNAVIENFTVKDIYFDTEVLKLIDLRVDRGIKFPINIRNFLFKNIHAKIPLTHPSFSSYFNGYDATNKLSNIRFNEFYINGTLINQANHADSGYFKRGNYADPLIFFEYTDLSSEIFNQNFNSSSSLSAYISATPDNGQFTSLSATGPGTIVSINSNKLRFNRSATADYGYFARTADFSPVPEVIQYKAEVTVSGNTAGVTQNQVAVFQVGKGFVDGNNALTGTPLENNALLHSRLGINFAPTVGQFSFRDISGALNSAVFSGTQSFTWVMNNSGKTVSYVAPDGSDELLAADRWDLWVGNVKIFDEKLSNGAADVTLSDLKFAFISGTGVIDLDNIVLTSPVITGMFSSSALPLTEPAPAVPKLPVKPEAPVRPLLQLSVYAAPDQMQVDVSVKSEKEEEGELGIYNFNGKELLKTKVRLEKGTNKFSLPVRNMRQGIHIATLITNSNAARIKFIR